LRARAIKEGPMSNKAKTGKEILDEFFGGLGEIPSVDKRVTDIIVKLYHEGRLTPKKLSGELAELREEADSE